MDLGAPDDDPIVSALDDAGVVIGVFLVQWARTAVAFDIGLGNGEGEIVVAAVLVEGLDPVEVVRLVLLIDLAGDFVESEEGVGADLFHEHDERLTKGRGSLDEFAALQKVVVAGRDFEVAAVFVRAFLHDSEVVVVRVLGHFKIEGGMMDRLLDNRVRGDISDFFTPVVNGAVVADGFDVLLWSSKTHEEGVPLPVDCRGRIPLARTFYPRIDGIAGHAKRPCKLQGRYFCLLRPSVPGSALAFVPRGRSRWTNYR